MSNDKVTLSLNKYVRENYLEGTQSLTQALCNLATTTFGNETVTKLMDVIKHGWEKQQLYITVSKKISRTRPQESYYRKWSRGFAEHCGMTPDEMHNEMLFKTFGTIEVETKFGWRKRPNKRSVSTTKQEYGELIETLIRTAAEMGYDIPPPKRSEHNDEN